MNVNLLFNKYKRSQVAELRPVTKEEYENKILFSNNAIDISVSEEDIKNNSPKEGDMVARNPKNHNDQWLVSKEYFEDNFEEM